MKITVRLGLLLSLLPFLLPSQTIYDPLLGKLRTNPTSSGGGGISACGATPPAAGAANSTCYDTSGNIWQCSNGASACTTTAQWVTAGCSYSSATNTTTCQGNVTVGTTNPIVIGGATGSCAGAYAKADGTGCGTPSGSGNTTSTSLTSNTLPKSNGANSIVNSSIADNGTTVSTAEALQAASFSTTSSAFSAAGTESSVPSAPTYDTLFFSSTYHVPQFTLAGASAVAATAVVPITCTNQFVSAVPSTGTPTCTSVTPTLAGLSNVTNDAQTKASVISNTVVAGAVPNGTSTSASSWTITPTLGVPSTSTGTHTYANATGSGTFTFGASPSTTTNTMLGPTVVPTTGHILDCTTSSTTCTLHDSGVVTATVVNASSPAAGIAHFAGSTQTVTSSTIATADIAGNAVTSAKMAVANTYRVCDIPVNDTSGSAITNAQLGPQSRVCMIPASSTIVELDVNADAGTPNVIVGRNHAGTITNIVSSALATAGSGGIACSNTGGTTGLNGVTACSSTLQNTALNAGDYLELVSGTAGGTAKFFVAHVIYTVN